MGTFPCKIFAVPLTAWLLAFLASGCGGDAGVGKTFSVAGKVTINDVPLTAENTVVLFVPDASKGNTSPFEPAGTVDEDGKYTVTTKGKNGAPPGWYKVVVTATESAPEHPKSPHGRRPVVRSLLPAKYGLAKTSDLALEVVENPVPGAYDLKLTR
ncbi:MAG TPA: hypothetical protein VK395_11395 [Gemmataceae bacterium]|nr:hypothetical protein [Gemmataceae bacterium]